MIFARATTNKKKLAEIQRILNALGHEAKSLAELGVCVDAEETGTTFEENALIKAKAVARATGMPSISDDSGLEVDALRGAPGVYSARYSGEGANDERNNQKLLSELADVPDEKRGARFRTVITCAFPDGGHFQVEGICEGRMLRSPEGDNGFGYDPLFYYEPFGKTFAALSADEKNSVSHRGKAMRKLAAVLPEQLKAHGYEL